MIWFKGQAIKIAAKIRDIPRQNFGKNRGQCLGKKLQRPIYTILSVYQYELIYLHSDLVFGPSCAMGRRHDKPLVDYGAATEDKVGIVGPDEGHLPRVLILVGIFSSYNVLQAASIRALKSTQAICEMSVTKKWEMNWWVTRITMYAVLDLYSANWWSSPN